MDLYQDLPEAKSGGGGGRASGTMPRTQVLFAAPQAVRRPAKRRNPPKRPRKAQVPAPGGKKAQAPVIVERTSSGAYTSLSAVRDEYDPSQPFDYESFCNERRAREGEERARKAAAERLGRANFLRHLQVKAREYAGKDETLDGLRVSGEEAFRRRANLGRDSDPPAAGPPPRAEKGMSVAEKMMAKMGWKKGEGLGLRGQGMRTPLEAQKTSRSGGAIVQADSMAPSSKKRPRDLSPTTTVVLRNMCAPGQGDGQLRAEVEAEAGKFGRVRGVTIEGGPGGGGDPIVSIVFENVKAAMRAHAQLDGRYFDGRKVSAEFLPSPPR